MTLTALATRKHFESDVIATHFDADDVQDSQFDAGAAPATAARASCAPRLRASSAVGASRPERKWR